MANIEMENINELHSQFCEYGASAKQWLRKCSLMLPDIEKYEVWRKKGFGTIYEYAAKLASMSRGQVDDALYILRKIENKPALLKVVEEKGINSVRPVVAIATQDNQKYWAEKAMEMSHHTLATYVREFRSLESNHEQVRTVILQLSEKLVLRLEALKGDQDWEAMMTKFVEKFEKSEPMVKPMVKPPIKEKASRHIPKKIKEYILKRSKGRCEFPNCGKKYKHLHHTNRFASNRTHNPDQIVALCTEHHDLAHKGFIKNEESNFATWKIQKYPDYTNLNRYIDDQVQFYRRS